MEKRILILSDSLALPRNKGTSQILPYESTWGYMLRQRLQNAVVAQSSIGSATSADLLYQCQYWTIFKPDLVFAQAGLCDCLPRAMRAWEVELAKSLPFGPSIRAFVAKRVQRIRKMRSITLTKKDQFVENVSEVKSIFGNVHWISILYDKDNVPQRFPGIEDNVRAFNDSLKTVFGDKYIDVDESVRGCFTVDSLHLEKEGQMRVLDRVSEVVAKELGGGTGPGADSTSQFD